MPETTQETTKKNLALYIELIKYPVLVFSLLAAVVVARFALGIEFGNVTEISTQGLKFAEANQALSKTVTDLETRLNAMQEQIKALEKSNNVDLSYNETVQQDVFYAEQTVSDVTANASRLAAQTTSQEEEVLQGYIWIGDWGEGKWSKVQLASMDSRQPITIPPEQMVAGTQYISLGNLVVRAEWPRNDEINFKGAETNGVIPRGSTLEIITPQDFDLDTSQQFWAEVRLIE